MSLPALRDKYILSSELLLLVRKVNMAFRLFVNHLVDWGVHHKKDIKYESDDDRTGIHYAKERQGIKQQPPQGIPEEVVTF